MFAARIRQAVQKRRATGSGWRSQPWPRRVMFFTWRPTDCTAYLDKRVPPGTNWQNWGVNQGQDKAPFTALPLILYGVFFTLTCQKKQPDSWDTKLGSLSRASAVAALQRLLWSPRQRGWDSLGSHARIFGVKSRKHLSAHGRYSATYLYFHGIFLFPPSVSPRSKEGEEEIFDFSH